MFFLLLAAVVQLAENKSVLEMAMLLCSQVCQLCSASCHQNLSVSSPSVGCFTTLQTQYRIAGKFGEVFNLAIWQSRRK